MKAFLTGLCLAAVFATGTYFALNGFTVTMAERTDDPSVIVGDPE